MKFVFDERKTAEAAAYLLRLRGGRMPYMKLIKLLYLADRESLVETGYPITGDIQLSMNFGPVLSHVLDAIHYGSPVWNEYVSVPDGYDVSLVSTAHDVALDELSPYDRAMLGRVNDTVGSLDQWALVRYTHQLPEWENPNGGAVPIDPRIVLQEAGRSDREIQEVAAEVEAIHTFRTLYAGTR